MGQPKVVIKTYEIVKMPVSKGTVQSIIRIAVWAIAGCVILGSLIFQTNLLNEMAWTTKLLFISLVISASFWRPKKQVTPSELEFWAYDDYFVVYRNKRYYSSKVYYREFNKFFFSDVSDLNYDCRTHRFNIYGKVDATFYQYDKNGNLPKVPHYHRVTENGICYFYLFDKDVNFVISNMEKYVGKKVSYRNKQEG